jgi:enediyne biosynthesis protein E4
MACFGILAAAALNGMAQEAQPAKPAAAQQGQSGGSAAGPAQPAMLDSEHRPITAGGFVKTGPVIFKDISESSRIGTFHHHMGNPIKKYILDSIGSGVALLDYDNDGWLDIYLVNGSTYDALDGKAEPPHASLFHNNHDGTFTDVAAKAGVTNDRWGFGAAVGDFDNDGWPDLLVTNYGKNRLYRNNHDGTFTDVGEKAGIQLGNWSTGGSFGDYDGDGRLDIFIPGYVHFDLNHLPVPGSKEVGYANCSFRGFSTYCGPRGLPGEPDHLFRNKGDGTFEDVSEKAGVSDKEHYYGFSSTFVDVNNDGKVDLVVTDDSSPNYLYMNNGDGTFEDASYYSGFALNQGARETASMGLAVGDYQNAGSVALYTTTFSDDYDTLYRNDGEGNFSEISSRLGLSELTGPFLSWGTQFIDYDNDGWKDVMTVSGHVYQQADQHDWGTTWAERPLLFRNTNKGKKFEVVPAVIGTGLTDVLPARGAAFGDLFNNGKIDVVINCIDHQAVLLRNVNADNNHWVGLKLVGGPKIPKDAIGATVYLTAGGMRQRGDVMSGGSFESSNDQRLHFGLGQSTAVDGVEIHWPGGVVEQVSLPSVDRFFVIEQGKGIIPSVYDGIAKQTAAVTAANAAR